MPLKKYGSKKECISKNISEMVHAGHPHNQAVAAAMSFCRKAYGGSKDTKAEKRLIERLIQMEKLKGIKEKVLEELDFVLAVKKWIQKATKPSTKGDFKAWCKSHGFGGVSQACINAAAKAGGRASRMASFAVNVSKGKYSYPKKKGK